MPAGYRVLQLIVIVMVAVPALAQQPAPSSPPAAPAKIVSAKWSTEESSLGSIGGYDSIKSIAMSMDSNHVVFIGVKGKSQTVVLDGKPGPAFDWIVPDSVDCGPDGTHLAYLVQTSKDTEPLIDGVRGTGFYNVDRNHIFWSPDGKRTAFAAQFQEGGSAMVVDGVAGARYDTVDFPYFSPDSRRLAYVATKGKQQFVVIDGQEQKAYDAVHRLTFSPNSRHLSYEGVAGGKAKLVLDGQEGKTYDGVKLGPGFSIDGARLVAVVAEAGKLLVLINGRESGPYEALIAGDFVLSPDGKRIAYAIKQGDKHLVILDGVPQAEFHHLGASALSFSPDSKRVAYVAGRSADGSDLVVLDGTAQKECEGILAGTPLFSPDSRRLAYGAKRGGKWHMNVDGTEGKGYDIIEPPTAQIFSPDSLHVGYRAANDKKPVMVIDGVESPTAESVGPIVFSPDSRHSAYMRVRSGKLFLVIDNEEVAGPYNGPSSEMRPMFDDGSSLHFIATNGEEFMRVKVKAKR